MGLNDAPTGRLIILLLTAASMLAVGGMANNKNTTGVAAHSWSLGFNQTDWAIKHPKKFVVGESAKWRFGFNYTDWVIKNGPFHVDDILVFKYDPPVNSSIFPHNVYLLPNYRCFLNCDFSCSKAKQVADTTQGGGKGFEFKLKRWRKPYYFACSVKNGLHCSAGLMKFSVEPLRRLH